MCTPIHTQIPSHLNTFKSYSWLISLHRIACLFAHPHSSITLWENGVFLCTRCADYCPGSADIMGTPFKKGRFWLYSCDWNPRLYQPFVFREWTWPIVKDRHPLLFLFFFFVPCNSHWDAVEQERAHSQLSAQWHCRSRSLGLSQTHSSLRGL